MNDCSLLTFNFNEYDTHRTHFISNRIKYIFLSDENCKSINGIEDPWYRSLYVRYHPFQFVKTDCVIVVDGSMTITNGIDELASRFVEGSYDIGLLLSHEPELIRRIGRWESSSRITKEEALYLTELIKPFDYMNYKGTIAGAVRLYRNTDASRNYLDICWKSITSTVQPIRLDEVPSTIALESMNNISVMPLSTNLIQGDAFIYNNHKSNVFRKLDYDKVNFWLMNKRVKPVYIGESYRRKFKYKTEIMCLTKYLDPVGLREWLDHHFALGFDHIHIFDNESRYDCKSICEEYKDRVSYEYIHGYARHYKIYDDYINSERSKSEWIFAIDDDEYLELNSKTCSNIEECIEWYKSRFPKDHMFAIRWKHLFPKKFHSEPDGMILDYCTEENPSLASQFQQMGDRGVKTIVHRIGNIHYEEAEENPSGGHVPVHPLCNGAKLANGELVTRCSCRKIPEEEPARLIHCRYKGYTWYKNKYLDKNSENFCYGNCSAKPYLKRYKFSEILESLD